MAIDFKMDWYTRQCRDWLDQRFAETDAMGYYIPHEPIYGFDASPRSEEFFYDYIRTFAILAHLHEFVFQNVLDVGSAEGYTADLIRKLFGVPVYGFDLSQVAVQRMWELFHLPGASGDSHSLPFPDRAFDVVLCSEVVEHVTNPQQVMGELIRITRGLLVITTPALWGTRAGVHVPPESSPIHAHIHHFSESEMAHYLGSETQFYGSRPVVRGLNRLQLAVVRSRRKWWNPALAKGLVYLNYALSPVLRRRTSDFIVLKRCGPVTRRPLTPLDRLRFHRQLLVLLIRRNALLKFRLSEPSTEL